LPRFSPCIRETGERAGFGLHDDSYYEDLFHLAGDANIISYARLDGAVVAFSWALCSGSYRVLPLRRFE
jgi:peptidoglycan pentaglycine glycine transferase (the first glycine)